jgi:hypothetical protein
MGVCIPRFGALGDSGHVATDAVGERMDGMGQVSVNHLVAHEALLGPGSLGLELRRRHAQLMDVVAGGAGDPFPGMPGMLPVQVLLVVPFGELICVDVFNVPGSVRPLGDGRG